MKQVMSGAYKVNAICEAIRELTDDDITEIMEISVKQGEYENPLKAETTSWQHELSQHNLRVIKALRELRNAILDGEDIKPPKGWRNK